MSRWIASSEEGSRDSSRRAWSMAGSTASTCACRQVTLMPNSGLACRLSVCARSPNSSNSGTRARLRLRAKNHLVERHGALSTESVSCAAGAPCWERRLTRAMQSRNLRRPLTPLVPPAGRPCRPRPGAWRCPQAVQGKERAAQVACVACCACSGQRYAASSSRPCIRGPVAR